MFQNGSWDELYDFENIVEYPLELYRTLNEEGEIDMISNKRSNAHWSTTTFWEDLQKIDERTKNANYRRFTQPYILFQTKPIVLLSFARHEISKTASGLFEMNCR